MFTDSHLASYVFVLVVYTQSRFAAAVIAEGYCTVLSSAAQALLHSAFSPPILSFAHVFATVHPISLYHANVGYWSLLPMIYNEKANRNSV